MATRPKYICTYKGSNESQIDLTFSGSLKPRKAKQPTKGLAHCLWSVILSSSVRPITGNGKASAQGVPKGCMDTTSVRPDRLIQRGFPDEMVFGWDEAGYLLQITH